MISFSLDRDRPERAGPLRPLGHPGGDEPV